MDVLTILFEPTSLALIFCVAIFILYRNGTSTFKVFSEQGIPGPQPLPYVGNLWGVWNQNMGEQDIKMIKKYGKVFGTFEATQPNLWIADPEIIKSILVKDFDHFINHKDLGESAKVMRKMVFIVRGDEWKDIRASINPAFSAGKIKKMSGLIKETVEKRSLNLNKIASEKGKFDAKRYFTTLTLEIITRCAYGLKVDNLGEPGDPFIENGLKIFGDFQQQSASMLIPYLFPSFSYGGQVFLPKPWQFFLNVLDEVIKERSNSKQKYNDFLDIATESILEFSREKKMWTPEETEEIISAQALELLIDGFETSATTLAYAFFLLARHPDIQEKLHEEVMEILEQFGEISHEMLLEMDLAEQILTETLRLYPIVPRLDRECNKDITYKGIHINKGMMVTIPAYALQHSEEYYPDPEAFQPERWSAENKSSINPYTYLPFGMGPRGCIGTRLAMEQMKMTLCTLISKIRFYPVEETMEKMTFVKGFSIVMASHDIILGTELRDQ